MGSYVDDRQWMCRCCRHALCMGKGWMRKAHVKLFWAALEELSVEARRLFLRLVWGQAHISHLHHYHQQQQQTDGAEGSTSSSSSGGGSGGSSGSGEVPLPSQFTIVAPLPAMQADPDACLPSADPASCMLSLPQYTTKEITRERL